MTKKMIGLFMAFVLAVSVSACGRGGKAVPPNPSEYTESEIGSDSGLGWPGGSRVNSKGQLVVFDRGNGTGAGFVTLETDGKPSGASKIDFPANVRAFALDPQDNIYAVTAEPRGEKDTSQKLTVISSRGETIRTADLGAFAGTGSDGIQDMGYTDIAVGPDGSIYLSNPSKGIQVLDKEGRPVKTLGAHGYESVDVDAEGSLLAGSFMGKRVIEKLDPATGKSLWSVDLAAQNPTGFSMIGSNKVRFSKADGCIYSMDGQKIAKYDSSGKLLGTAIDFKAYTILASGYTISDMCPDGSGNIYVTTTSAPAGGKLKMKPAGSGTEPAAASGTPEDIKYELYKYSPQKGDGTAQSKKVITVVAPVSNRALEIAAGRFQKDNSGYRLDIQAYTGSDYETYVKNLNTQILSGRGADILSVAGLPYESYIARNVLADLSGMMAGDGSFDMDEYYANIFDALKYNGKLYVLPTSFSFNVLMANQGILDRENIKIDDGKWTWDDFKAIAGRVAPKNGSNVDGGRRALPSIDSMELLDLFTGGSYSSYIDVEKKRASFTSGGFAELLSTVRDFGDGGLTDSSIKRDMVSILEAAGRGTLVFYPYSITDYNMYGFMKAAFKDQLSLYNMPSADGAKGGNFTAGSLYAINRNSKYKAESWEFLKTLLSDEVQSQNLQGMAVQSQSKGAGDLSKTMGGFSVNKAAQQQKAQQAIDASTSGNMKIMMRSGSGSISLSPAAMSQRDIDDINRFISGLNTHADTDANISSIIEDETKGFFSGDKTAQETAKRIQDRVNTYLGE